MLKVEELIKKYNAGLCTDEEKAWLEQWYHSFEWNKNDEAGNQLQQQLLRDEIWQFIQKETIDYHNKQKPSGLFTLFSIVKWQSLAAAAIIIMVVAAIFFQFTDHSAGSKKAQRTNSTAKEIEDVLPGTSKAQLLLADGRTISLDSANNMKLTDKDGTLINKHAGKLIYTDKNNHNEAVLYNTLATPKGGEYQLVLPDGSKVWLNAASSVKFPTKFAGKERVVFLTGEAYFEVAENKQMPFLVKMADDVTVTVLGTHFNIMSYDDEEEVRTTLAQGKVTVSNVHHTVILSPSTQAVIQKAHQTVKVGNADVAKAIAWKNGMTEFNTDNLRFIMRQLSRWYDVEVSFAGNIPNGTYTGAIRRQAPLSKVLEILKAAGVQYITDGKKITITGG